MNIKQFLSGALVITSVLCFQAEAAKNFWDNGNGTVTDNVTSLIWQQGEGGKMAWDPALTYCESLTLAKFSDWRLPNKNELLSLVDDSKFPQALDSTYFPGYNGPSAYWSSTTYASQTTLAWAVGFGTGASGGLSKTGFDRDVRCVRGGQ